jgi:hypothetical protein
MVYSGHIGDLFLVAQLLKARSLQIPCFPPASTSADFFRRLDCERHKHAIAACATVYSAVAQGAN